MCVRSSVLNMDNSFSKYIGELQQVSRNKTTYPCIVNHVCKNSNYIIKRMRLEKYECKILCNLMVVNIQNNTSKLHNCTKDRGTRFHAEYNKVPQKK